jgi:protein-tyrosine phosphatase
MPSRMISSAGIKALVGQDVDKSAARLLEANGYKTAKHAARKLDGQLIAEADLVLVMENDHQNIIMKQYPQASGKILLLGKWQGNMDIHDPYRRSDEVYNYIFNQIEESCLSWCDKLEKQV